MIFLKQEHQLEFEKKGYIVLPVINENYIEKISKNFDFEKYGIQKPFYISIDIEDTELRKSIQKNIQLKLETYSNLQKLVNAEFMLYSCSFISQINEQDSGFYLHTDWSFFDQTKNNPVYLWMPLQDVSRNKKNGTMIVVPGSHKITIPFRGEGITEHYIEKILKKFNHYYKYLEVPKGHAVFFNPAIIHGLLPNIVSNRSISIFSLMCEKNAEIIYCHKPKYSLFNIAKVYKVKEIDDYWYVKTGVKNKDCFEFNKFVKIPNTKLSDSEIETILNAAKYEHENKFL